MCHSKLKSYKDFAKMLFRKYFKINFKSEMVKWKKIKSEMVFSLKWLNEKKLKLFLSLQRWTLPCKKTAKRRSKSFAPCPAQWALWTACAASFLTQVLVKCVAAWSSTESWHRTRTFVSTRVFTTPALATSVRFVPSPSWSLVKKQRTNQLTAR